MDPHERGDFALTGRLLRLVVNRRDHHSVGCLEPDDLRVDEVRRVDVSGKRVRQPDGGPAAELVHEQVVRGTVAVDVEGDPPLAVGEPHRGDVCGRQLRKGNLTPRSCVDDADDGPSVVIDAGRPVASVLRKADEERIPLWLLDVLGLPGRGVVLPHPCEFGSLVRQVIERSGRRIELLGRVVRRPLVLGDELRLVRRGVPEIDVAVRRRVRLEKRDPLSVR
jgi:hypothetical protein